MPGRGSWQEFHNSGTERSFDETVLLCGSGAVTQLASAAALRNRDPILDALRPHLPNSGTVLEVASGTGQHVVHLAAALPGLRWQPTEPLPEGRASIDAWAAGLPNVLPAKLLDAASAHWPIAHADAVLCINMIHIAPWAAAEGLFAGASRLLAPGGLLTLYGPYRRDDRPLEPSNAAFDADLRRRNPEWGLREVRAVAGLAARCGFAPPSIVEMPANNLLLLFRRDA
jgi:SAM-dependent methyltransferase